MRTTASGEERKEGGRFESKSEIGFYVWLFLGRRYFAGSVADICSR